MHLSESVDPWTTLSARIRAVIARSVSARRCAVASQTTACRCVVSLLAERC